MGYIENNKLIAESPFCPDWVRSNIDHHTDSGNDMALNDYMENLKFHSEWRWLMPVVEKIEKMGCIIEISIGIAGSCNIINVKPTTSFYFESNSNINAIYQAVIQFIQWFNQQNKL